MGLRFIFLLGFNVFVNFVVFCQGGNVVVVGGKDFVGLFDIGFFYLVILQRDFVVSLLGVGLFIVLVRFVVVVSFRWILILILVRDFRIGKGMV